MNRIARNRRYYEKHKAALAERRKADRACPEYRDRENAQRREWYQANALAKKMSRAFGVKISSAREMISANL